jgi:transcriptional regulator of heat shock response
VSVFIGEENIIPELETSAMIIKRINLEGEDAYIGTLGSMKMDYAFNKKYSKKYSKKCLQLLVEPDFPAQ